MLCWLLRECTCSVSLNVVWHVSSVLFWLLRDCACYVAQLFMRISLLYTVLVARSALDVSMSNTSACQTVGFDSFKEDHWLTFTPTDTLLWSQDEGLVENDLEGEEEEKRLLTQQLDELREQRWDHYLFYVRRNVWDVITWLNALDSGFRAPGSSPSGVTVLCSWVRQTTHNTAPYKKKSRELIKHSATCKSLATW